MPGAREFDCERRACKKALSRTVPNGSSVVVLAEDRCRGSASLAQGGGVGLAPLRLVYEGRKGEGEPHEDSAQASLGRTVRVLSGFLVRLSPLRPLASPGKLLIGGTERTGWDGLGHSIPTRFRQHCPVSKGAARGWPRGCGAMAPTDIELSIPTNDRERLEEIIRSCGLRRPEGQPGLFGCLITKLAAFVAEREEEMRHRGAREAFEMAAQAFEEEDAERIRAMAESYR